MDTVCTFKGGAKQIILARRNTAPIHLEETKTQHSTKDLREPQNLIKIVEENCLLVEGDVQTEDLKAKLTKQRNCVWRRQRKK